MTWHVSNSTTRAGVGHAEVGVDSVISHKRDQSVTVKTEKQVSGASPTQNIQP